MPNYQDFRVSEQEQQLLEILREWSGDDDYRLEISRTLGAWEVKLSQPEKGKWAPGVGATLDDAWDNVGPSWS
jgi:hypothetical protein